MISHVPPDGQNGPYRRAMPWTVRMMLNMDYSLSHGHHGIRPCSPDHIEAAGPVGPAVDQVLSFVITEPSPFALLAALLRTVRCQQPMIFWSMIMKRLTHA